MLACEITMFFHENGSPNCFIYQNVLYNQDFRLEITISLSPISIPRLYFRNKPLLKVQNSRLSTCLLFKAKQESFLFILFINSIPLIN